MAMQLQINKYRSNEARHLLNCNDSINIIGDNDDFLEICDKEKNMNAWE